MVPNVLVLVMDAARAGNFSAYGHDRDTSPNTDALASNGRLFERAVPPAPATFDSVTSVLSGTYPCEHKSGQVMEVNTSKPLLPEVLSERGYTTGFATSSPGTTPAFGYGAGVDEFADVTNKYDGMNVAKFFDDTRDLPRWKRYLRFAREACDRNLYANLRNAARFRFGFSDDDGAREVTAAAKKFISNAPEPWFLYLHYTETHLNKTGDAPYAVPDEYLTRYTGPDPAYDDLQSTNGAVDYDDEQVDRMERLYDGAIRYLDRQVGELTDFLRERDEFDETLVTVTSDHGEVLGERGFLGHATLEEPVLQVPLVMHGPGVETRRVSDRVNLLGLYRTVAALSGDVPDHARGSDLLGDSFETGVLCQDYTETWKWSQFETETAAGEDAFYAHDLKLVRTPNGNSLYDVRDGGEERDVSNDQPEQLAALEDGYRDFVADLPVAGSAETASIDDQTAARLEELGYIE